MKVEQTAPRKVGACAAGVTFPTVATSFKLSKLQGMFDTDGMVALLPAGGAGDQDSIVAMTQLDLPNMKLLSLCLQFVLYDYAFVELKAEITHVVHEPQRACDAAVLSLAARMGHAHARLHTCCSCATARMRRGAFVKCVVTCCAHAWCCSCPCFSIT